MTTCYFIRHGVTQMNAQGRVNGALVDTPLMPIGIRGAKEAGESLQNILFDRIYASPQMRAVATAEVVLRQNNAQLETPQPIRLAEPLREMSLGDWEGHRIKDYTDHPQYYNFVHAPSAFNPASFNGEPFQTVVQRGVGFMQQVVSADNDQTLLFVGHGTMLTILMRSLLGVPYDQLLADGYIDNTSISVLTTSDGRQYKKIRWNDTSFLSQPVYNHL
ncbi:histidine phosphatase family protein [Loigolactobacillus iwatensis]|uniref:histidine phosphatase family protein n=1 Tax=Loigolactobacillus iwatensis TaxID=1267156 RepID=UPI0013DD9453|nr:histidine phosphatase family protein [Loigolactobacillus iwatensis]